MGNRLSIRARLVTLMLVPAFAMMALTGVQLNSTRTTAASTAQFESLVGIAGQQFSVLHALQIERTRSLEALYLGRGGTADMTGDDLRAARQATDAAREQLLQTTDPAFIGAVSPVALEEYERAQGAIEAVIEFRATVDSLSVTAAEVNNRYGLAFRAILAFDDEIAPLVANPQVQARQQLAASFARLKATILDRRDTVLLASVGEIDRTSATRLAGQFASQQVLWTEIIGRLATEEEFERVAELATINPGAETARVANGLLSDTLPPVDVQAADNRDAADALREIEIHFTDTALATAQALRDEANRSLLLLGLVTAAALGFTLLVLIAITRGVVRPLRRLTALAQRIGVTLPETVEQVAAGAELPESDFATPANADLVERGDELGDLAKAIRKSTETAVNVALGQAQTRAGVAKTIMDVARREQSLVEQQLALLDRLEDAESNPEQLANLFGLDHLATRMRRNAENLLLFASGELPGSPTDAPAPIVDVIRGAAAEIEEYIRVDVNVGLAATVAGYAATPVSHLLAELVENATLYSPPNTRVQITARRESGGVRVSIRDHGIGMSEEEMAAARQKLAETPLLEAAESRRLGLYVVGLLSARLGITVELSSPADGNGTVVDVGLPDSLFIGGTGFVDSNELIEAGTPEHNGHSGSGVVGHDGAFALPVNADPIPPVPSSPITPVPSSPITSLPNPAVLRDIAPPVSNDPPPPVPVGLLNAAGDADPQPGQPDPGTTGRLPSRQSPAGSNGGAGGASGGQRNGATGLSLARESGVTMPDLDQDLLGGFFNHHDLEPEPPTLAPRGEPAADEAVAPQWNAAEASEWSTAPHRPAAVQWPGVAAPPASESEPGSAPAPDQLPVDDQVWAPAPQTGAFSTPSWAPPGRGRHSGDRR
ncbi:MAG TPA: nitrate- and nitrite sensing domain-containing protein [Euzebya sp.]|nr:nitrate- and nitrite sensing domain-containing protein [Euzebya sp.]